MHLFDTLIALALLIALPADALWRSRAGAKQQPRIRRYARTIAVAATLDAVLAIRWSTTHRTAAALGLGWPPPLAGWIGLAIATVLIVALAIAGRRTINRPAADLPDMLPRTAAERRLFVALALIIGASWEILYRGFLLWWLAPATGIVAAIVIAATAYGVAHGYRGWKPFAGSIAAAFVFTIGYALTASLWWLIAIHIAMPLVGLRIRPRDAEG